MNSEVDCYISKSFRNISDSIEIDRFDLLKDIIPSGAMLYGIEPDKELEEKYKENKLNENK